MSPMFIFVRCLASNPVSSLSNFATHLPFYWYSGRGVHVILTDLLLRIIIIITKINIKILKFLFGLDWPGRGCATEKIRGENKRGHVVIKYLNKN
jgi:hypothetical protein